MASVSEESLTKAANDVLVMRSEKGLNLTDGVKKKASELGLNREQTARLIERTNSEAFLKSFPASTEFDVADPEAILSGIKTASVKKASVVAHPVAQAEKVASDGSGVERRSYAEQLDRSFDEIFGNEPSTKIASYSAVYNTDSRQELLNRVYGDLAAETIRVEKTAALLQAEEAEARMWSMVKESALNGRSVADMELELLYTCPEKGAEALELMNHYSEKLAECLLSPEILRRATDKEYELNKVAFDTELTRAFKDVVRDDIGAYFE